MAAIDYAGARSLTGMFFDQAARLRDKPLVWRRREGGWKSESWTAIARQVEHLARGLLSLGLKHGDRVLLVAENRPEWLVADLAIMAAGGVTVPGYVSSTVADQLHLINNSSARLAVVSTRSVAERIIAAGLSADHPPAVITIEAPHFKQNPGLEVWGWDDILAKGAKRDDDIPSRVAATARTDTACIIYTSGTAGAPRGVMLSHGAILSNCDGAENLLAEIGLDDEVFLSFLPLSHAYEHTAGHFFPISLGAEIYYATGFESLVSEMGEVRPTIMTAVPRLYEVIRAKMLAAMERKGGITAKLFSRALALGAKHYENPKSLSIAERVENIGLDLLVRRKVANRFGGRLKALVSGGGPLNYEVGLFFLALGVRILQGYGQTESAPVVSCNRPFNIKVRTVGPPLKGVDVRIADDGEIMVRGELVMQGYWRDEDATSQTIRDGWLLTGDIGVIDHEGFITITDRKKDIIVNSGGDNVSPQRVEGFLTLQPSIGQAMVYGDRRPHLVALIVPDAENAAAWATANGKNADMARLVNDPEFRRHINAAILEVNQGLSPIEKVRRFVLAAEPFSVANSMMTPTMKIRRHIIRQHYGDKLDALYD